MDALDESRKHKQEPGALAEQVAECLVSAFMGPPSSHSAGATSDDEDKERTRPKSFGWYSTQYDSQDDLNLAGLLNVIDGVVDAPGRILVMTTNHPEKLDPALIRPGRINKKMHLGYLNGDCLC